MLYSTPVASPDPHREGAMVPYLRAVAAHRWLVLAVALLTCVAATAYAIHRVPHYAATTDVLVTPLPQDDHDFLGIQVVRDSGDPTRTVQTAASLIDTPQAAEVAARNLGHGTTRQAVAAAVIVQPVGQSNIIGVTATATDPRRAALLADAYAAAALALRGAAVKSQIDTAIAQIHTRPSALNSARLAVLQSVDNGSDPTLSVSIGAFAPNHPVGTATSIIAVVSLFAGLLIGSIAALLLERIDRRVGDAQELVGAYPLPVLANVPPIPRGDLRKNAGSPFAMPPGVREAFRSLQVQLDQGDPSRRTVMVTSATRGDGKTTTALNLAFALVAAGHTAILIDFDLRKPEVGSRLGLSAAEPGLAGLITSNAELEAHLVQAPGLGPLRVLPAGAGAGDVVLLNELSRRTPGMLAEASALADYVVVDTAPLGEISDSLPVALAVDRLILVARPGNTNRRSLEGLRDLLERNRRAPDGLVLIGQTVDGGGYSYGYGPVAPSGPARSRLGSLLGD